MLQWINPKNGGLSTFAGTVILLSAVGGGALAWWRVPDAGGDTHEASGIALCAAAAAVMWGLLPVTILFRNRFERVGYVALSVWVSAFALAGVFFPGVFR